MMSTRRSSTGEITCSSLMMFISVEKPRTWSGGQYPIRIPDLERFIDYCLGCFARPTEDTPSNNLKPIPWVPAPFYLNEIDTTLCSFSTVSTGQPYGRLMLPSFPTSDLSPILPTSPPMNSTRSRISQLGPKLGAMRRKIWRSWVIREFSLAAAQYRTDNWRAHSFRRYEML